MKFKIIVLLAFLPSLLMSSEPVPMKFYIEPEDVIIEYCLAVSESSVQMYSCFVDKAVIFNGFLELYYSE